MMYLNTSFPPNSKHPVKCFFNRIIKFIGASLLFFSFSSLSATQEQIAQIQNAAEQYILDTIEQPQGGALEAKSANIDSRIFATDCPIPLITSSRSTNQNSSNITVLVECPEDNWKTYVSVRLKRTGPQVSLNVPMNKGQVISAHDVGISMVDLQRLRRQGFSTTNAVIGAKVKKNLRVGDIIEQNDICVVCRNDTVTIKAAKSGMTITTKGVALTDGAQGEQIRVKNSKSNRIIDARVTGISEVTVIF
ncbi:flagellar basal body P-ring formation chaperone FlgA [Vibrio renipiscarius]|uniref:Flagella basal body P-ring formation protein FlgA n=1 Tax=Vibrio renipiscarius TaxID=1461322 RepID=A0A0C2KIV1_9VIBR|nr:flagellar basal body P-ring formation chaperone FlgA [Vibrio renipiscarius]KII80491.1 flagellar basal body P-ring biosynthesis protein FlgA [Vibrio renipiscarius]KII82248.1 flagellar basal body P-ring biosynthesis protein FlgA [Vibrio renipiscarius]